jgi:hypothetical protein
VTNTSTFRLVAAIGCIAALGGCENTRQSAKSNPGVCINFSKTAPAGNAAAPAALPQEGVAGLEDCIQRWSYSLAPSRDEAPVVADAVVSACGVHLTRWNQQIINSPQASTEGASITTGQPTNPIAEHYAFTRNRALFYVVQARAGNCAPPPAKSAEAH